MTADSKAGRVVDFSAFVAGRSRAAGVDDGEPVQRPLVASWFRGPARRKMASDAALNHRRVMLAHLKTTRGLS